MKSYSNLFLFILSCALFFFCCTSASNKGNDDDGEGYHLTLRNRIGDDYKLMRGGDTIQYISYPFNIGQFRNIKDKNLYCVVFSKQLTHQRHVRIQPFAMMQIEELGETLNIIMAVPSNDNLKSIFVDDYSDFVINFAGVKNIVESWFLNRCGYACSEIISWHDEQYADFFLQKRG